MRSALDLPQEYLEALWRLADGEGLFPVHTRVRADLQVLGLLAWVGAGFYRELELTPRGRAYATRVGHWRYDANARKKVYIGRGARWGNPFVRHGVDSQFSVKAVDDPLVAYEAYVRATPALWAALPELAGKVLGCFCVRLHQKVDRDVCHGHVLRRLIIERAEP